MDPYCYPGESFEADGPPKSITLYSYAGNAIGNVTFNLGEGLTF